MLRLWLRAALLVGLTLPCAASRTVTDETGRAVIVPDHPHRVISLVPSITDTVYALGAGDDVVGISDYATYPAEAKGKPSVGSVLTPSTERILALHPDLLLAIQTQAGEASVERFRQMGIPIFLIDPHGLEGIFRSVVSVGDALNRRATAEREVAQLRARVDAVQARVRGRGVVSVLMPIWYEPVMTIGRGSYMTDLIAAAGGRSVTADIGQEWPQVSLEAVVARAPEALVLKRGGTMTLEVLRTRPGWRSLPAVVRGRVFYVDDRMEMASPVAIGAVEDLAREMHP